MKHYIIAKFKKDVDWKPMVPAIEDVFRQVLELPGVRAVSVLPNCVDRPNRFDLMIEIEMERESLETYDACEAHKIWKKEYGHLLESKVIFDRPSGTSSD